MTVQNRLQNLYEMIEEGNPREAEAELRSIFNGRRVSFGDRYVALKGICRAMDMQGQWIESETVWKNLHARLEREHANHQKNRGFNPFLVAAGIIGFALLLK